MHTPIKIAPSVCVGSTKIRDTRLLATRMKALLVMQTFMPPLDRQAKVVHLTTEVYVRYGQIVVQSWLRCEVGIELRPAGRQRLLSRGCSEERASCLRHNVSNGERDGDGETRKKKETTKRCFFDFSAPSLRHPLS